MRLSTFSLRSGPAQPRLGVLLDGRMLDLAQCARLACGDPGIPEDSMKQLIGLGQRGLDRVRQLIDYAASAGNSLPAGILLGPSDIDYLPPLPDADKFLCVGKNYRTHLEELKRTDLIREMPTEPTRLHQAQLLPHRS